MPCTEFEIDIPQIPGIFVALPILPPIPLPLVFTFCCRFEVPDIIGLQAVVAGINASIQALGGEANAVIAMVEAEILAAAAPILELSLTLSLDCPLD